MKRSLFITLIVLVSVLVAASLAYGGYTTYRYLITLEDFEVLETTKALNINNADSYTNNNDRITDASLEEADYSEYKNVYKKDNIYFLSNTDSWSEDKLMKLADELYKNKHGEEIKYLSSVILNEGEENPVRGTHESSEQIFEIPVSLYNFLPVDNFCTKTVLSEINLYQADKYPQVIDMAIVLSHEYGHHFTNYHFGLTFTESDKQTEYYKIRANGVDGILLSADSYSEYIVNHMWYLTEIAAEDYVYFMGSGNAHRVVDFYDAYDRSFRFFVYGKEYLSTIDSYKLCRNGTPHENIALGLPSDIVGLEQYFYSFIDENVPKRKEREDIDIGTLNLSLRKPNSRRREFTWEQPYTDFQVTYTLILYNEYDQVFCMAKTTKGNQEGIAKLGNYALRTTKGTYIYDLKVAPKGTKLRARVSITFSDGTVMLSDPIDIVY